MNDQIIPRGGIDYKLINYNQLSPCRTSKYITNTIKIFNVYDLLLSVFSKFGFQLSNAQFHFRYSLYSLKFPIRHIYSNAQFAQ